MQAPGQVQRGSGEGSEGSEGSEEGLRGFGAEPGHVQQGSGKGSGEGVVGFGARPGQVQQGSRKLTETQLRCFQQLRSTLQKDL